MTGLDAWPPTRAAGLARLEAFLPEAGKAYAARRNYDLGPGRHVHVSGLSPYLRRRLVAEEEVVRAVLRRHSASAAEKFVQEVFWRTYWKGWLERRPSVWTAYEAERDEEKAALDDRQDLAERYAQAVAGRTGIECFDAWARELVETGWLHNHARMWFASVWIFTLELPWTLGADFFLRHLLDGDPASNTLGWRWVAGLQTRGKTYLARASNIAKYTEGRFRPDTGDEPRLAPFAPPLDGSQHPPALAPPEPEPPNAGLRTGLLVTEEDLHPEALAETLRPASIAILRSAGARAPRVEAFAASALDDVAARLSGDGDPAPLQGAEAVVDWAKAEALEQVVTLYAPVGPVRAQLDALGPALAGAGAPLRMALRDWDRRAWPHASKGFFAFKEKIPRLLAALDGSCGGFEIRHIHPQAPERLSKSKPH